MGGEERKDVNAGLSIEAGLAYHKAGWLTAAAAFYRKVLADEPRHAGATHFLGMLLHQTGRCDEGLELLRRSLELGGNIADFHANLGAVLGMLNRPSEALAPLERAVELRPCFPDAYKNLGLAYEALGRLDEAIRAHRSASTLAPENAEYMTHLGRALYKAGQISECGAACRAAVSLSPQSKAAWHGLARARLEQGRAHDAAECYRRLAQIDPTGAEFHSGFLHMLLYDPNLRPEEIAGEHRQWAAAHALRVDSSNLHANDADASRRIRIGYVSPDFREHPVARFAIPLIEHHDRAAVEVFWYADVRRPDAITRDMTRAAASCLDCWRDVTQLSPQEVVATVRSDRVDVLVDLSGHSGNRLIRMFGAQAAPVQITQYGYPATTGIDAIKYRITDNLMDPPGMTEGHYVEELIRLPRCAWCYRPAADAPPVGAPPMTQRRRVTFCCFNKLIKATPPAVALWARILQAVPGSRLLVGSDAGAAGDTSVRETFEQNGIPPATLQFIPRRPPPKHLSLYEQADIALDPFPHNGGVSTCDAMWMGVPTVTLAGGTCASRLGVSLLSAVGLQSLIAATTDEYVGIAVALANNPSRLRTMRADLRESLKRSELCDERGLVATLEQTYRSLWALWCAGR